MVIIPVFKIKPPEETGGLFNFVALIISFNIYSRCNNCRSVKTGIMSPFVPEILSV
jgi:hypothetical protein